MTDSEINIAIAEACGWKWKPGKVVPFGADHPEMRWHDQSGKIAHQVPGYCSDLNAMHEAVRSLDSHKRERFIDTLWILSNRTPYELSDTSKRFNLWNAPPELCAEAFLRTIGKWRDG